MKKLSVIVLTLAFIIITIVPASAAVMFHATKVMYFGGTVSAFGYYQNDTKQRIKITQEILTIKVKDAKGKWLTFTNTIPMWETLNPKEKRILSLGWYVGNLNVSRYPSWQLWSSTKHVINR